jgi:trans-aconitate 2-methyltransferase
MATSIPACYKWSVVDAWDPVQYAKFSAERRQPFDDLVGLVQPVGGGRAVDLGCGTGALTVEMHRHLGLTSTLGIDSSATMLEQAPAAAGVAFSCVDISAFETSEPLDLIFANASLQWVPDHAVLLGRLAAQLASGGQLAVQVPSNADHRAHLVAAEVAAAYIDDAPEDPVAANVLAPERYAELLHSLGFEHQHVRLQVYGHLLPSTADVVEWTKGTTLTRFRRLLEDDRYADLVDAYRRRLLDVLGDRRPFFYPFKRLLLWGRMPL